MIEAFENLSNLGFGNVVFTLLLLLVFFVAFMELWKKFISFLGIETKAAIKERELNEKLEDLEKKINDNAKDIETLQGSAKKFNEDRVHDREQSFEKQGSIDKKISDVQTGLTDMINSVAETQKEIIKKVDSLAEQSRKYQLADIRETLLQAYRYYTGDSTNRLKAWTEMEANAFWEQYATYKDHGGNGYMESVVKPEMNKLRVIPLSDVDAISELMESRHQHKN